MEIQRQYYTEEFKQEAVKLVKESGLSIAEAGILSEFAQWR